MNIKQEGKWSVEKMNAMLEAGYSPIEVSMEKHLHDTASYKGSEDCALCDSYWLCSLCPFEKYSKLPCFCYDVTDIKTMSEFMEVIYICDLLHKEMEEEK